MGERPVDVAKQTPDVRALQWLRQGALHRDIVTDMAACRQDSCFYKRSAFLCMLVATVFPLLWMIRLDGESAISCRQIYECTSFSLMI